MTFRGGAVSVIALGLGMAIAPETACAAGVRIAREAYEAAATAALNLASAAALQQTPNVAPATPPAEDLTRDPGQDLVDQPTPAPFADAAQTTPRRDINPYDRDIAMTVPLNFNQRVLGEMPVILTRDDQFRVESAGFQSLIKPLLTKEAQEELAARLTGITDFSPEEINPTGIRLDYDPDQLAVLVLKIDPTKRNVESLFRGGAPEEPGLPPSDFSAYLNTNMVLQRIARTGDVSKPSVFLNGAARYKSFVFEADVQGREDLFTQDYNWERRYARLVYDQPEQYRRWYLGDLNPEQRGRQGFVELGGLGVERQRRRFESFRNNRLSGARQLILQEASTVRVLRNGVTLRELKLDPGQYDLSNLPLETGSNDIQLEVRGDSGRIENVQYSAYLDLIDLEPGDYEYGAYLGVTSNQIFGSPDYSSGEAAFTGYWRKAFENRPALGLGLQASERAQTITGQTQFILRNGARLQLDAAASNGDAGAGYAYAAAYDHFVDLGETYDTWTVAADYTSEDFSTIGNPLGQNQTSWVFTGSYSHRFTVDWLATVSAYYRMTRVDQFDDVYGISATTSYRFTPQWSAQFGVEVIESGTNGGIFGPSNDGVGVTFALVWQPRFDRRGDVRYSSATNTASVNFQQYADNTVGSLGYSVNSNYIDGAANVSGQVDYIANRFDASLTHSAFGRDFSSITDDQITSLRVGTSIATAGGRVAVGRSIYDSFAIVYPHPSLGDRDVIVGDSLEGGKYISKSGLLGSAVTGQLSSYINQSVRYDVLDPPRGYNIGEGVARVRPTYRSGYAIQVGSANFVSAMGRLVGNADRPVALISGRVQPVDEPNAEPELFFTNSVGRFAVQNLEPGKRYRVELFSSPALGFEFTVPADNDGLLDLQIVKVPLDVSED